MGKIRTNLNEIMKYNKKAMSEELEQLDQCNKKLELLAAIL